MSALPTCLPSAFQLAKLQAVPAQPTAADRNSSPVILTKPSAVEAELVALLDEYGIELQRMGHHREPGYIATATNFLGDHVLYLGPDADLSEALQAVRTFISRHSVPPVGQNPGHSANRARIRLVPAKVGPRGRVQTVHVECPWWCTVDHGKRIGSLDDLMHTSYQCAAELETLDGDMPELTATLSANPASADAHQRAAHIELGGIAGSVALTPDLADEAADELITLAARLRDQAAIARRFNQGGGRR
ncbi:DUF6907 domain-containing protein [Streptomyces flavochromogenes]|uniref:DUF6907 domain-containing protein n=1 Tax=Streptomyces flavochromogenes TaxID=68199 RepID=A0ABW6XQ00_9ACTN